MKNIVIGGRYRHYKGNEYVILTIGRNSENPDEELVVYQAQYNNPKFGDKTIWIRPKKMFLEKVKTKGKLLARFQLI